MIVLHAVMTYDRSIGTREAGSGNVCVLLADPRGACTVSMWLSAASLKKADPPARSAGLTRGSA